MVVNNTLNRSKFHSSQKILVTYLLNKVVCIYAFILLEIYTHSIFPLEAKYWRSLTIGAMHQGTSSAWLVIALMTILESLQIHMAFMSSSIIILHVKVEFLTWLSGYLFNFIHCFTLIVFKIILLNPLNIL